MDWIAVTTAAYKTNAHGGHYYPQANVILPNPHNILNKSGSNLLDISLKDIKLWKNHSTSTMARISIICFDM